MMLIMKDCIIIGINKNHILIATPNQDVKCFSHVANYGFLDNSFSVLF